MMPQVCWANALLPQVEQTIQRGRQPRIKRCNLRAIETNDKRGILPQTAASGVAVVVVAGFGF